MLLPLTLRRLLRNNPVAQFASSVIDWRARHGVTIFVSNPV